MNETYGQERIKNSPLTLTLDALRAKLGNLNELSYLEVRAIKEKENGIRSNCEGLITAECNSD